MAKTAPITEAEEDARLAAELEAEQAAMAALTNPPPSANPQDLINARLVELLGRMADKNDQGPTPQIPFAKATWQTPWNPSGERYKEELSRETRINGHRLQTLMLSQEEVSKLNRIRPGKYRNKKWVVIETDGNDEGSSVDLYFPHKTAEHRMEIIQAAPRGLVDILDIILAEQNAVTLA